jgi:hypothetical protein
VGRVKARWKDLRRQRTIGQLLPKEERERLSAQGSGWLTTPVTTEDREADLPLVDPASAKHIPNEILNTEQLARAVITQLP